MVLFFKIFLNQNIYIFFSNNNSQFAKTENFPLKQLLFVKSPNLNNAELKWKHFNQPHFTFLNRSLLIHPFPTLPSPLPPPPDINLFSHYNFITGAGKVLNLSLSILQYFHRALQSLVKTVN